MGAARITTKGPPSALLCLLLLRDNVSQGNIDLVNTTYGRQGKRVTLSDSKILLSIK